jgi:Tfp pilus assembly protein PilF
MMRCVMVSLALVLAGCGAAIETAAAPPTSRSGTANESTPPLDTLDVPPPTVAGVPEYVDGLDGIEKGTYADAVEPLSRAIEADEENADYYTARGLALLLNEKVAPGMKDLQRAVRLDSKNAQARRMLSFGYRLLGDERGAANALSLAAGDGFDRFLRETGNDYGKLEIAQKMNNPGFLQECRQKRAAALMKFGAIGQRFAQTYKRSETIGRALFGRGVDRYGRGEFAGARADLQSVLAAYPDDAAPLYYHALSLWKLGNYEGARQELTLVLTAKPALVEGYVHRGLVAAAMGDMRRAQADLNSARRLDPGDTRGLHAAAARQIADAASTNTASPVATADPQSLLDGLLKAALSGAAWDDLVARAERLAAADAAQRLRGDERYQDRRLELELARYAAPRDPDRHAAAGLFLLAEVDVHGECVEPNGDWRYYRPQSQVRKKAELDQADQLFDTALAIDPKHVGAHVGKATLKIREMQWADAEDILRVALENHGDAPQLLDLMSQVMQAAANQRFAKAADLRQVRSWTEYGYNVTVYWSRYPSLAERDRADAYDEAAKQFVAASRQYVERAIAGMAGTDEGFYHQGLLDVSDGKTENARAALEQAVKLDPSSAKARYALSNIYAQLGQAERAIEEQTAAKNLEATSAAPWLQRAWSKIVNTAWKSAREALDRAARFDAADARIPAYLGVIAQGNEKTADARAYYRAAIAIEEAHARLRGDTVQPGGDGLGSVREFGLSMALRLKLAGFEAEQSPARAAELCLANVALEPRISEWAWGQRLSTAMLPDPEADTRAQPFPPQMAVLMAQSRLAAGRSLLAVQKPEEAMRQFAPVIEYPQKLHEGGTIYLEDYLDWARLGLCDACIRLGDKQSALAWQMKVQGREFENPIEIERMRLRNLLGRQGRNRS